MSEIDLEFVTFEWEPDPRLIEVELLKLADDLDNWEEPLAKARAAIIYGTEIRFESQIDPYLKPWMPLDPDYAKRKEREGYPENILQRTGALLSATTSEDAWLITERDIVFNTAALPLAKDGANYGAIHQSGTLDLNANDLARLYRSRTLTNHPGEESLLFRGTGIGRGNALPQRQFIGIDEDTAEEVEQIFLEWLDKLVDDDLPQTGFNVEGEFPIIGFLPTGQPRLSTGRFGRIV